MQRILIVDDDGGLVHFLRRFFTKEGYEIHSCNSGEAALPMVADHEFDLVLLDYKMAGLNGLETLAEIRRARVKTPIVVMTAYGTTDVAIEAMKLGAYDYLLKPFNREELQRLVRDALEVNRLMKVMVDFPTTHRNPPRVQGETVRIIGKHKRMQEAYKLIGQVATKDVNILITGESGTGKELVARAVYHHSHRKDRPFLAVNCAAIPETLFESELFGHERGAFTGAERIHIGKFERCHGGTLFLDEIGDMPLSTQAKVLRVLQCGEFERLGGTQTLRADVRIIAATNKNLEKEVEHGRFREDLYWRVKIISIDLPPLRERGEDIPALTEYFMSRFNDEYHTSVRCIEDAAVERLKSYSWPGNTRELENCIRRAVLLSQGDVILEEHLKLDSGQKESPAAATQAELTQRIERKLDDLIADILLLPKGSTHENVIETIEKALVGRVLKQCGYNQVRAARTLGISRNTLRHRMKKFETCSPVE